MQKTTNAAMTTAEQNITNPAGKEDEPHLRDLFLFTTGGRAFGVPADEVEGTADTKRPTPLPYAPPTILGVVYVRGRVLTVLDPSGLAGDAPSDAQITAPPVIRVILSLRGDEQLALAADAVLETITVSSSDIESPSPNTEVTAIAGILLHGGEKVTILDPARLFDAVVHRKDRRRRRF
jgi:purine-binding chemotaxis protein CheW